MFVQLAKTDALIVGRSLLALALIIVFGVAAAESQLLTLTQQYDFVQVFNIRQETAGVYTAYLFGEQRSFSSAVTVGTVETAGRNLIVGAGAHRVVVPTSITLNVTHQLRTLQYWSDVWYRQFLAEAWRTKAELSEITALIGPQLLSLYEMGVEQLQRLAAVIIEWW